MYVSNLNSVKNTNTRCASTVRSQMFQLTSQSR